MHFELDYDDIAKIFSMAERNTFLLYSKKKFLARLFNALERKDQHSISVSYPDVYEKLVRGNMIKELEK